MVRPISLSSGANNLNFSLRNGFVRYTLVGKASVSIRLLDLNGRHISTIVNQAQAPGSYAVPIATVSPARGCYILSFEAGAKKRNG